MKKIIPTETRSWEVAPLRTTLRPFVQVRTPSAKGIRNTTQSKGLVFSVGGIQAGGTTCALTARRNRSELFLIPNFRMMLYL